MTHMNSKDRLLSTLNFPTNFQELFNNILLTLEPGKQMGQTHEGIMWHNSRKTPGVKPAEWSLPARFTSVMQEQVEREACSLKAMATPFSTNVCAACEQEGDLCNRFCEMSLKNTHGVPVVPMQTKWSSAWVSVESSMGRKRNGWNLHEGLMRPEGDQQKGEDNRLKLQQLLHTDSCWQSTASSWIGTDFISRLVDWSARLSPYLIMVFHWLVVHPDSCKPISTDQITESSVPQPIWLN